MNLVSNWKTATFTLHLCCKQYRAKLRYANHDYVDFVVCCLGGLTVILNADKTKQIKMHLPRFAK